MVARLRRQIEFAPLDRPLLVVLAVLVTASGLGLVLVGSINRLVNDAAQAFVIPPPMLTSLLAGLFTRRGGYLLGMGFGLLSAVVFTLIIFAIPDDQALQITVSDRLGVAAYAFVVSPIFGLLAGGLGALGRWVVEIFLRPGPYALAQRAARMSGDSVVQGAGRGEPTAELTKVFGGGERG